MANIFGSHGLTDSLLDAVRDVQSKSDGVSKHAAFGYVTEKKKMDPVGGADADIDNDSDVDKSDKYLHNRRKAIKKANLKQKIIIVETLENDKIFNQLKNQYFLSLGHKENLSFILKISKYIFQNVSNFEKSRNSETKKKR